MSIDVGTVRAVSPGSLSEDEVYDRFLAAVKAEPSIRAFAKKVGFTPSYIHDIVHKRRPVSDTILTELGIRRVVTVRYERVLRNV